MNKTSFTLTTLAVMFGISLAYGQLPAPTFSESAPYIPRAFPFGNGKGKNNDAKAQKQSVTEIETPETFLVPVSVVDGNGRFVSDLAASDFSVYLDGSPVRHEAAAPAAGVNIILMVDMSPSANVEEKRFEEFARAVVEAMRPEDKMSIVEFHGELTLKSQLTADRKLLEKAISRLKIGDGTSVYDSVEDLFEQILPTIPMRSVVLVLTDAIDTTSRKSSFERSLMSAESSSTTVFPIYFDTVEALKKRPQRRPIVLPNWGGSLTLGTIGSGPTQQEKDIGVAYLNDLAKLSGGRAVDSRSLKPGAAVASILEEVDRKYFLQVHLPKRRVGQRFGVKVRVNRPNLQVFSKGSYVVAK